MPSAETRAARTQAGRCPTCGHPNTGEKITCASCRARMCEWRAAHPGYHTRASREWNAVHQDAMRAYYRRYAATGIAPGTVLGLQLHTEALSEPGVSPTPHPATRWWWDITTRRPILDEA